MAFGGESGRALLLSLLLSEREDEVGSAAGAADEGERALTRSGAARGNGAARL